MAQHKLPILDGANKIPTEKLGGLGADGTKYLRGDQTWSVPGTVAEFELDGNGNIQPTLQSGTIAMFYDLSPAETIVADTIFEADGNGDLQPKV